ncbi:MAG: putative transcriptional regulator [Gammaproteobacteria bacterium]|jgi:ATP-dependent DNA helicase RecG|nr:putative transcriptional regulator [Gammaproteobacteria bacterium]
MDIDQITALIQEGESPHLEFKKSTAQLKSAFETACAFLNRGGGIVLIGVKNDGQRVGQDVTDHTRQEIAREIKKIEPSAPIDVHYIPIKEGKFIIVLEVMLGRHAPYVYDGRPYERVQSSTGSMSQHLYEQLLVRRGQLNHTWEKQPAPGYELDSLDHEEIRRTIKEGVDHRRISVEALQYDIEHILRNLNLLKDNQLINAAIVLYAKNVLPNYANCMIKMARFIGVDKTGDFIDNQRIYGNAFHLMSEAHEFVKRHLPIAGFFEPDRMQRIDQPAVPTLALREALINAIIHRDYVNRSASISLAIYDDRLELWNVGILPPELKIEDLKKPHESHPRNEEIATIFYERGLVEGWGTGTLRMISYCQKNGTPEPEFQEYSGGFAVIFHFKERMGRIIQETGENVFISQIELTLRQKNILKILSIGRKMSISDILSHLEDAPAMRTLRDDLARLKEKGLIDLEGRAKGARWFLVKR